METVVGVEGNDEGKVEETGVEKSCSALSSPKQIADPVVYKLVRVYFFYTHTHTHTHTLVCVLLLLLFLLMDKLRGETGFSCWGRKTLNWGFLRCKCKRTPFCLLIYMRN